MWNLWQFRPLNQSFSNILSLPKKYSNDFAFTKKVLQSFSKILSFVAMATNPTILLFNLILEQLLKFPINFTLLK